MNPHDLYNHKNLNLTCLPFHHTSFINKLPRIGVEPIPLDYKTNVLPDELTGVLLLKGIEPLPFVYQTNAIPFSYRNSSYLLNYRARESNPYLRCDRPVSYH